MYKVILIPLFYLHQAHPGTNITIPNVYSYKRSLEHLWSQVPEYTKAIQDVINESPDGVNMVCYSQGKQINA